ncbi:MAG TPA: trehalose-6-phosphate synthase, partial [Mycobacterium sp.]|nr:trehalose-6-phosphate synthase [Mycobacterium sp.]
MAPGSADFVVVANRLPVDQVIGPGGETGWKRSPGGLVTALEPLLRQQRGAWIGWPGIAQDDTAAVDEPVFLDGIEMRPVRLDGTDVAQYYEGFSNATLWPVFHYRVDLARYERQEYHGYRRVNTRFAHQIKDLVQPDDILWVHDYHLIP